MQVHIQHAVDYTNQKVDFENLEIFIFGLLSVKYFSTFWDQLQACL